jgi:hypothetical protein
MITLMGLLSSWIFIWISGVFFAATYLLLVAEYQGLLHFLAVCMSVITCCCSPAVLDHSIANAFH